MCSSVKAAAENDSPDQGMGLSFKENFLKWLKNKGSFMLVMEKRATLSLLHGIFRMDNKCQHRKLVNKEEELGAYLIGHSWTFHRWCGRYYPE